MRKQTNAFYGGNYQRNADSKNRIAIRPDFNETVVSRNSKDETVLDLYSLYIGVVGKSIACYDHATFNRQRSKLDCSLFQQMGIDGQKRLLIPEDITKNYPLVNPMTVSASKDGEHFTIKSSLEEKVR